MFITSITLNADVPETLGIGLSLDEFQTAVESYQASKTDHMGFGLTPCKLKPLLPNSDSMQIGRAIDTEKGTLHVTLVGLKKNKVTTWKQYPLPGFEYWVSKYILKCVGKRLTLIEGSDRHTYIWNGTSFSKK